MDPVSVEMVGEDELPDAQTLANLNAQIHGEITETPTTELLNDAGYLNDIVQLVQTQCGFALTNSQWARANRVQLSGMVLEAYQKADYSALMRISTSLASELQT